MPINFIAAMTADAMAYLATNRVTFRYNCPYAPEEVARFTITRIAGAPIRYRTGSRFLGMGNAKATGENFEVFAENPHRARGIEEETFTAVWSGYRGGHAIHCDLRAAGGPDVMLTPMLDGCTLTWQRNPDGSARFGHYNLKAVINGPTLDQDDMRQEAINRYGTEDIGTMSKEYYYNKAKRINPTSGDKRTMANAFGVRHGGGWHFYIQYIEAKGVGRAATMQIRGVEELAPARWYNLEHY
jgi:hypothetical protein